MTHYETLEVTPNASSAVIRAAYKTLVQKYHPDRNPGNQEFANKTQEISSAYSILCDEEKRAAYDRFLAAAVQSEQNFRGVVTAVDVSKRAKMPAADSMPQPNSSFSTALLVCGGLILLPVAGYLSWKADTKTNEVLAEKYEQQFEEYAKQAKNKERERRTFKIFPNGYALKIEVLRPTSSIPEVRVWNIRPITLLVGKIDSTRVLSSLANNAEILQRAIAGNLSGMKEQELLDPYVHSQINYRIQTISNQLVFGYIPVKCLSSENESFGEYCLGVIDVNLQQRVELE